MRYKLFLPFLTILFFNFHASAQLFEKSISSPSVAYINDVTPRSNGNNLVVTRGFDNTDFPLIMELNMNGDTLWTKQFKIGSRTRIEQVRERSDNKIVIAGYTYHCANGCQNTMFLAILDTIGNLESWQVYRKSTSVTLAVYDMVLDDNNNIYVASSWSDFFSGGSTSYSWSGPVFMKFNSDLTLAWSKRYGTHNQSNKLKGRVECVVIDDNGDIYTWGYHSSSSSGRQNYLAKWAPTGTLLWSRQSSISGYSSNPEGMALDENNAVYAATETTNPAITSGWGGLHVVKVSNAGDTIWSKAFGISGKQLKLRDMTHLNNNLYLSGYTDDLTGGVNGFIVVLDTAGLVISSKEHGGTYLNCIKPINNGQLMATGYTFNSVIEGYMIQFAQGGTSSCILDTLVLQEQSISSNFVTGINASNEFVLPVTETNTSIGNNAITIVTTCTAAAPCITENFSVNDTICIGNTYLFGSQNLSVSGTYTETFSDIQGCDSVVTLDLVIDDFSAPLADIASLSNVTSECEVISLTPPTATDNCAGAITGTYDATLPITSQGTTVVTWTYDDGNGNTSTQTQNVIIDDVTAPIADVATLSDLVTSCGQPVNNLTPPTATDNCVGSVAGTTSATLPITSSTTITWTYDDGNGNTSTQTQNVVINVDNTAPVADVGTLTPVTAECQISSILAPTATDNCSGTITGTPNVTFPITTQGTSTITWTYDDGNGNTSTQTQEVIIDDVTAPIADVVILSDIVTSCGQPVNTLTPPTATDNCVGSVASTTSATLPITSSTTITWTYDDGNGNTSTQTQNVVINVDNTAPVADIGTLTPVTAECQISSIVAPTATDNCSGTITGTPNVTFPITTQGSFTITWTYDDGNGNTSTQTQNVTVEDLTLPVVDNAILSDVTGECEVTSLTAPTATDNCAGSLTGTHGTTLPITSTTTITWTYDDGKGNTSTQTQEVIIDDVTAPVADAGSLTTLTAQCEIASLTAPTATDNCIGSVTGTTTTTLPTTASTTITWTYDDGNGNTSTQTQEVIINDNTAPVADIATLAGINSECEVTPTAPTATDNCAGAITGTPDVSFPVTAAGTTTITWTYHDGNGNTAIQTQEVIITPIDNGATQDNDFSFTADASGYNYQWIDCENGNAPIPGATNQTFEATANGSYAVIIDNGDCSVTSACFDVMTVGLSEGALEDIQVYPNPTSGAVMISSSTAFTKIEVLNTLGQAVQTTELNSEKEYQLELPEAEGVYLIRVTDDDNQRVFRIIKR